MTPSADAATAEKGSTTSDGHTKQRCNHKQQKSSSSSGLKWVISLAGAMLLFVIWEWSKELIPTTAAAAAAAATATEMKSNNVKKLSTDNQYPKISSSTTDKTILDSTKDGKKKQGKNNNTQSIIDYLTPTPDDTQPHHSSSTNNTSNDTIWWKIYVDQIARPFRKSSDVSWCRLDDDSNSNINNGLFLVKTPKAGSSTAAAVTMQIAENVAYRLASPTATTTVANTTAARDEVRDTTDTFKKKKTRNGKRKKNKKKESLSCVHQVHHGWVRHRTPTDRFFMWSPLRHPAKRSISSYFFGLVSRLGQEPSYETFTNKTLPQNSMQFQFLNKPLLPSSEKEKKKEQVDSEELTQAGVLTQIDDMLQKYNFIAITERFDESFAVMSLLFDFLELEDFVTLSSKRAGGFDDGGSSEGCVKIMKPQLTEKMEQFMSTEFVKDNLDYFLYEVVNRSLDLTIEMFGRELVDQQVQALHELQTIAEEQCLDAAIFPCTEAGPPNPKSRQSCYFSDVGCGHECIQTALRHYSW